MELLGLEKVLFGPVNVDLKYSSSFDMNIEIYKSVPEVKLAS